MAFLFLSVALLPFSMKAVGFEINVSPRVGAVVEAWTQVAGVFVVGYHPFSADSWSSLDSLKLSDTPESAPEASEQCSLIAQLYSIGSGESCDLTKEPVEVEAAPAMEARSFAPRAVQKTYQRMSVRRNALPGPAPIAEAMTIKADDDVIVKVSATLPALAIRYMRPFNSRAVSAPKPAKMRRVDREAFKREVNRLMRDARFEKTAASMAFQFHTSDKEDRIECDVDQVATPAIGLEPLEKARRVRVSESQGAHEL